MADRPILFSGPMVRALLAGTKTQTRRVFGNLRRFGPVTEFDPTDTNGYDWHFRDKGMRWHDLRHVELLKALPWQAGDRLWVKEAHADEHPLAVQAGRYSQLGRAGIPGPPGVTYSTIYRVDGEPLQVWRNKDQVHPYFTLDGPADDVAAKYPTVCSNYTRDGHGIHWDNSRYMPRWASRLTLTVTEVRVQRLQEISEADAHAEGTECIEPPVGKFAGGWRFYSAPPEPDALWSSARDSYHDLWDTLNAERGFGWSTNPWVVAVSFSVARCNIDAGASTCP